MVTVFDLGNHTDGSPFIAMELLKGQDLQKAMRQTPPMTVERKVAVIVQVLAGLAHAHQAGIVHRDIKPANIFIQEDGSVKIMDFGVARLTTASMTGTGNIVGTADYMSPEQVKGAKVDGRSDLFSVGCMLFELAAGRRPFHSDNLMAIFYKITHEEANFDLIPQGAEYDALMPILKKALAKNLDERYQTAYEFAVDLREWLKAHATTASTQNVLEALVDLEAPTHAPMPMTEAPGMTVTPEGGGAGATVDLGRRGPRKGTIAPTRVGGRTVADSGPVGTMRPGATRVVTAPPVPRVPARPQPAPKPSVLPWVAVTLALVAVGVAGWLAWKSQQAPPTPPVTQQAVATPTPPPPTTLATPAPPPVTAAPRADVRGGRGKAAAQIAGAPGRLQGRQLRARGGRGPGSAARGPRRTRTRRRSSTRRWTARRRPPRCGRPRSRSPAATSPRPRRARRGRSASLRGIAARPSCPGESTTAKLQAQRDAEAKAQSARTTQINGLLNQAATALPEQAVRGRDRRVRPGPGPRPANTSGRPGPAGGDRGEGDRRRRRRAARGRAAGAASWPAAPRRRAPSRAGSSGSRTPPASP